MNALAQLRSIPWGDRTVLIAKRMSYVSSLTFAAQASGNFLRLGPWLPRPKPGEKAPPPTPPGLQHIFGDTVTTMPEGLRCDLPLGKVLNGDGEIGSASETSSPKLSLRLRLDLGTSPLVSEILLLECLGTLTFTGGPGAFRSIANGDFSGNTFIATRQEVSSPTYRWLNRRQLYGVGRVEGKRSSGERDLVFSFDLYAGA